MVLSAPDRTFPARLSLIAMTAFSVRLMLVAQPAPVDIGDGLKVSAAGIGMMEAISPCISGRENEETFCGEPLSPEKTRALVTGVIGAGCAHFDTAQEYKAPPGKGQDLIRSDDLMFGGDLFGEEQLGRALVGLPRSSYTVGTKYSHGPAAYIEDIEKGVDESLQRLGVDSIDLYYLHRPIMGCKTKEQLVQAMRALKACVLKGKIRHIGLSEIGVEWLRVAHAVHPIAAIQMEWSLASREIEADIVPVCIELGIGIVAYAPLARLMLALNKDEIAKPEAVIGSGWAAMQFERYLGENLAINLRLMDQVAAMAAAKRCSTAQLSLAWLYHRARQMGVPMIAIPGTSHLDHALDNAAAVSIALTAQEMQVLETVSRRMRGARGGPSYMSITFEAQQNYNKTEEQLEATTAAQAAAMEMISKGTMPTPEAMRDKLYEMGKSMPG